VFLFIGASLGRQFEFVQRVWVNDGDFAGLDRDKDPIVGANDGTGHMVIQARLRRRIPGIPRFVVVRGGEYFFLPGIRALGWLAGAGPERAERAPRPAAPDAAAGAASITDPGGPTSNRRF
jgi:hypothetical protein